MGMFSFPRRTMNRMPVNSANIGTPASTPQNPRPVTPRVGPNTYTGPAPMTSAQMKKGGKVSTAEKNPKHKKCW